EVAMHYASTVAFEGDTAKAYDLAAVALTAIGFRIAARDGSSLDMIGPGLNSTRQSALLGATRIQVTPSAHELSVDAALGGAERLARFVTLFPVGLSLFLCAVFFIVFSLVFDHRSWVVPVLAVTGANALLWLFLAPMLARSIRARTCRAIDALLNNMVI